MSATQKMKLIDKLLTLILACIFLYAIYPITIPFPDGTDYKRFKQIRDDNIYIAKQVDKLQWQMQNLKKEDINVVR
jgi:hypothetical protein